MTERFDRIGDVIRRHAAAIVVAGVISAGAALHYTVNNLGLDTSTSGLFSDALPWRQTFLAVDNEFPQYADNLLIVIDGHTPEIADRAASRLAARLREVPERFEWVFEPGGGPYFERHALLYMDLPELDALGENLIAMQPFLGSLEIDPSLRGLFDLASRALDAEEPVAEANLESVLAEVARGVDDVLDGRFYELSWRQLMLDEPVDLDDKRRLLLTQVRLDYSHLLPAGPILAEVRGLARELGLTAENGVRVRISGGLAISHEEMASLSDGMLLTGFVALALVGVILTLGLRSVRLVVASLATLLIGLCWTGAFAAVAVGELNLISIGFAVLYIGFGIDFSIHLTLRYREVGRHGNSSADAIGPAMRDMGGSLFLCALTTGLGFFAFVPTDFSAVADLGLISGVGMFISLLASMTLLPAMLMLGTPRAAPVSPVRVDRPRLALADWPERHRRAVIIGAGALAIVSLVSAALVSFDRNPLNLRDDSTESVSTLWDLLEASDTSPWPAVILVDSAEEADRLKARLDALDVVDSTRSLGDFVPSEQDEKLLVVDDLALTLGLGDNPNGRSAPPTYAEQLASIDGLRARLQVVSDRRENRGLETVARDLGASLVRLETALRDSASAAPRIVGQLEDAMIRPLTEELARIESALGAGPVAITDLPPLLARRWLTDDGRHRIEVFSADKTFDNEALRRFVDAVTAVAPGATDTPVTTLRSGDVVVSAFLQAIASALAIIAVLLLGLLRNVRDTLVVLAPLLLGSGLTLSAMLILGMSFNFANVIALPLMLGVGVDNGIHLVHRARSAVLARGELLRSSTTRAVVISALTTICSFGGLSFSAHPGTASMGQILAMGVGFTMLCSLVVTPALLAPAEPSRQPDRRP